MEQFPDMSDGNINISDVIEVIQTDPEFAESMKTLPTMEVNAGRPQPYVEIVEQPASKALRFRYECEGRSAGSIPGVNSTAENKTFPSIRIVGYKGRALVVVSCVTKDVPHRPHPHNLVGKEACKKGVCTVEVSPDNMTVMFANLGIQCIKKKDIDEALRIREEIRVDPFRTGFEHKRQPTSIDLNAVKLCFQVFLEGSQKGKFNVALPPIVSDTIYDKKAMSDLVIAKLSHCSASVAGGMEMILLCEKVAKEDIQVRFFEERDGQIVWEGFGDFQTAHVHKQTAIAFRTPTYRIQQVDQPVQVHIQLRRPSDGATSEPPLPFQMLPLGADEPDELRRKRRKYGNSPSALVLRHIQAEAETHPEMLNQTRYNIVKPEPNDRIAALYGNPDASGGSFPLFPMKACCQQYPDMQTISSPVAAEGRPPSPLVFTPFHPSLSQPQLPCQYQATSSHVEEPFVYALDGSQVQLQDQLQEQLMDGVTPILQGLEMDAAGICNSAGIVRGADATSVLDMDNQQYSFDSNFSQLNSADLTDIGTELPDVHQTTTSNGTNQVSNEERNRMTDRLTRLTAELNTLSSMYKPKWDD